MNRSISIALASAIWLTGCATVAPSGPGIMALPGTGKTFEQFRFDDVECRNFASFQNTGSPTATGLGSGTETAAAATLLGAAAGAAFNGGRGAAVGAGTGLLVGSSIGSGNASASSQELQRRYDIAYTQCMYGRGNRVPISGRMTGDPDMRGGSIPAPPPGSPPPAPPRS